MFTFRSFASEPRRGRPVIDPLEARVLLAAYAISSGQTLASTLGAGVSDRITFDARAGDSIEVAMGMTSGDPWTFQPQIDLYGPNGTLLESESHVDGTRLEVLNAPQSGTYSIIAADSGGNGTGAYNLTLAKLPGAQASGGDGGPIVSGQTRNATLIEGDLDVFTFAASAGDSISVAMGMTSGDPWTFQPEIDLYAPNGAQLDTISHVDGTRLDLRAPQTGTYFVVAGDSGGNGTGDYALTLAKVPGPQASGNDAGPIAPAQTRSATLSPGDLDVFTFTAQQGKPISVSMGMTSGDPWTFQPQIDLYGPNGVRLKTASHVDGTRLDLSSGPETGNYFVVTSDSGGNGTGGYNITAIYTPPPDFRGTISGSNFSDANADGSKGSGEGGLAGVTVFLDANENGKADTGERTSSTDGAGNYRFFNLDAGTYRVRQVVPAGYRVTTPASGYFDVALASGQDVTLKGFGDTQKVLIAGNVYNDLNGGGTKSSGETGIAGWRVFLDADNDGVVDSGEKSVLTDSSGNYRFNNLVAGTYRARLVVPAGWRRSQPSSAAYTLTLGNGAAATGKNFGATQRVLISGTVFNDLNGDRVKNSGEAGLSGWRVYVDADNDGKFDSGEKNLLTDSRGNWAFRDLAAGAYRVRVVPQSGWGLTTPTAGVFSITVGSGQTSTGKLFGARRSP
jgi:protocatechuate 3,4-dioxygenase beta subunit